MDSCAYRICYIEYNTFLCLALSLDIEMPNLKEKDN